MLKNNNNYNQKHFVVICNFLYPSNSEEDNKNKILNKELKNTENFENKKSEFPINFLELWVGDFVKIISSNGEWCFGYRLEEPENQGIFPFSYVQEMTNKYIEEKQNLAENEAERLASDISEALKEWIEIIKFNYGEGISTLCQFEQQINLIKQLLVVKRQICSGTVTAEEIREYKLVLADVIDSVNYLLNLNMQIRDDQGIYANIQGIISFIF